MIRVEIELEFEGNEVSDADVYNYLNELMDNNCLDWTAINIKGDCFEVLWSNNKCC